MLKARALFSKYDLDGSGSIDRDELEKIFEECGQKPTEDMMKQIDPDGSGSITFMEFVNAFDVWNEILKDDKKDEETYKSHKVTLSQQQMAKARQTFSKYDIDGDGTVSSSELFNILKNLLLELHAEYEAHKQATDLMAIIDADGDGSIFQINLGDGIGDTVAIL
jgi:Ca2+-binding EF-hand superfamily protein